MWGQCDTLRKAFGATGGMCLYIQPHDTTKY